MLGMGRIVFGNGEKSQAIGVLVVARSNAVSEQENRSRHEHEAHEHLQDQDFQRGLLSESEARVAATMLSELTGITTAQSSGDMRPA